MVRRFPTKSTISRDLRIDGDYYCQCSISAYKHYWTNQQSLGSGYSQHRVPQVIHPSAPTYPPYYSKYSTSSTTSNPSNSPHSWSYFSSNLSALISHTCLYPLCCVLCWIVMRRVRCLGSFRSRWGRIWVRRLVLVILGLGCFRLRCRMRGFFSFSFGGCWCWGFVSFGIGIRGWILGGSFGYKFGVWGLGVLLGLDSFGYSFLSIIFPLIFSIPDLSSQSLQLQDSAFLSLPELLT